MLNDKKIVLTDASKDDVASMSCHDEMHKAFDEEDGRLAIDWNNS